MSANVITKHIEITIDETQMRFIALEKTKWELHKIKRISSD